MPQTMADSFKKGALVRVNRKAYVGSLEAAASAPEPPAYLLEGPGEAPAAWMLRLAAEPKQALLVFC